MSRRRLLRPLAVGCALVLTAFVAGCGADGPDPSKLVAIGAGLQGPSGLDASVYATGLANVAALAFDPEGRLWASTATYDDAGTDAIFLVTRAGATPTRVVSGLHTALGLLWYDGELYVASKERVEAYRDFDGTTLGSKRTVVTFSRGVGEVNGLALSKGGRISLGISSPCDACDPTAADSAAVVSFRPDGTGLRVDASGIRAAVGLAYDRTTGDLFATMNQRDDLGAETPGDWLGVVAAGQDWRYPACYGQGGAACAGAPAPVAELDRHAALSGVALVTDGLAGAGRQALVVEWTQGIVQRVGLSGTGPATKGTATPFLTGFENPVPVVAGPDGSLFIGDWKAGTITRVAEAAT